MGCSSTRDVPARPQRAYGGGRVKMTQFRSAAAKPPLSKRRLRAALRNGHQPLESADLLTPIDVRAVERVAHHLDGLGFGVRRQSRRFQSGAYAPHSEMAISLLKARTFSLRSMCASLSASRITSMVLVSECGGKAAAFKAALTRRTPKWPSAS